MLWTAPRPARECHGWVLVMIPRFERATQCKRSIGFDIAKSVFQVHGIDAAGNVVIRRKTKRRYIMAFFCNCSQPLLAQTRSANAQQQCRMTEPKRT